MHIQPTTPNENREKHRCPSLPCKNTVNRNPLPIIHETKSFAFLYRQYAQRTQYQADCGHKHHVGLV